MDTGVALLLIAVGVLAAFAGAELLSRGLSAAARGALLLVGGAAAALAATAPEILFAARASWDGAASMALGLTAGSLTANALLVAPLAAGAAAAPQDRSAKFLALWTAAGALALIGLGFDGELSRNDGVVLTAGAVVAAVAAVLTARRETDRPHGSPWIAAASVLAGLLLLLAGAVVAVDGAIGSAAFAAGGGLLTGLTLFGLAAALPELAAAVAASHRGGGAVALGNVTAGAAIAVFGAPGVAALVRPLPVDAAFMGFPAATLAAAAATLAVLVLSGGRLPRRAVVVTAAVYLAFLAFSVVRLA